MTQQCETCEKPIREHCYVSIGPEQQIFCFKCCPLAGPPKINPDRIICGGSIMTQLSDEVVEHLSDDECAICGKSLNRHSMSSGYGVCQVYPMFVSKRQIVRRLLNEAKGDVVLDEG